MQCPLCRKKLVQTYSEGMYIQRCPECNGIWFPQSTILDFLKQSTKGSSGEGEPPKIQTALKEQGFCPACNKLMELYAVDVSTKVNRCMECGGFFVGIAELGKLEYLYCQPYWKKIEADLIPNLYKDHEFISEGNVAKGLFGLIEDDLKRKHFPWVTLSIILLNVLMMVLAFIDPKGAYNLCLVPQKLFADPIENIPLIFTSLFSHASLAHLFGNMYFLWIFGDNLEDILGSLKYCLLYLLFGIIAALLHSVLTPNPEIPTLGASGAVSGIMGGYLFLFPKGRIKVFTMFLFRGFKINLPVWFYLGVYFFGMQLLSVSMGVPGVAWWAHLSGFVAGFLALLILKKSGNL